MKDPCIFVKIVVNCTPTPSGGVHTLINDNIDDNEISNTSTWSSNKISEEINNTKSELHLEMQTVSPVNLLDNSDFTNPVNQKGQSSYSGTGYSIDRWYTPNSNFVVSIIGSGVKLSSVSSSSAYFIQKIEGLEGKTLTAAVCLEDGSIYTVTAVIPIEAETTITLQSVSLPFSDSYLSIIVEANTLLTYYQLKIGGGQQITCKWAALYEGEYTAETLPKFIPKGYANELVECKRYYQTNSIRYATLTSRINTIQGFKYPVPMRITPTITIYDEMGNAGYVSLWGKHGIYKPNNIPATKTDLYYINLENPPEYDNVVFYKAILDANL